MVGSFLPFPRSQAERQRAHDPRPSIEERYAGRDEFLSKVEASARELAKAGYLLERDVASVTAHSAAEWDWVANGGSK